MKKTLILLTAFLLFFNSVKSQPGSFETSFGNNGKVAFNFSTDGQSELINLSKLADGKILCVGTEAYKLAFARLLSNGSPDPSYGINGKIVTAYDYPSVSKIQQDGKVIVASGSVILRFDNNGSPDPTFAGGSIVLPSVTDYYLSSILSIENKADGKILVLTLIASTINYPEVSLALFCFNQNGTSDLTFGVNGVQKLLAGTFGPYSTNRAFSDGKMLIREDGKIMILGALLKEPPYSAYGVNLYVARLNSDGSFDNSFDGDGKLISSYEITYTEFGAQILADNKILVGMGYVLLRLNENGLPDDSFAVGLSSYTGVIGMGPTEVFGKNIKLQDDGKIMKIGSYIGTQNALFRYNADGAVDPSFGNNGGVVIFTSISEQGFLTNLFVFDNTCYAFGSSNAPFQSATIHAYQLSSNQFTCPANITATTALGQCSVTVNNIDPGTVATFNYTLSGATTGSGTGSVSGMQFNTGITTVTYSLADAPSQICSFTVTVDSYTLLGIQSIKLQQNNTVVNGSVGVVSPAGNASMKKNVSIAGPGAFLKAQNISLQAPYTIPTIIYTPANVALPTMIYNTTSTSGLSNITVPNSTTTTLNGNLKNVTIGANCNVSMTGNIFGAITIGSGSTVTFSQSVVDVTAITMNAGTVSANTQLKFSSDATVRCAGSILVNSRSIVNPDNHKVIFYLGKTSGAPVAFTVAAGGNETLNASIYIPSGKISVGGDATNMTYMSGKFIAENIETLDKNVIWNWYDCTPAGDAQLTSAKTNEAKREQLAKPVNGLNIKAWPNPSEHQFLLNVESSSSDPINIRVYDMYGRMVFSTTGSANKQHQFGNRFVSGTYIAEVRQGANRSTVKLVKQ